MARFTILRIAVAALLLGLAAACSSSDRRSAVGSALGDPATAGQVRVGGVAADGDVLWIDGDHVVAAAPLAGGTVAIPPASAGATSVLVRIDRPAIGVWELPGGKPIALDVPADHVSTLRGTIGIPAGVTFDWVELSLTPRLTTLAQRLVLADGTTDSIRAVLATRRLATPAFSFAVIDGTWDLRVDRLVDGPLGSVPPPLETERMTARSGPAPIENVGGWRVTVAADVELDVALRQHAE